jgi:uncharacterized protein
MPEYLAPGVYVEETSFRAKSIEGVSTTTTGFVGPTRYGPIDQPPEVITSLGEFERVYGGREPFEFKEELTDPKTVAMPNFTWHAARAFFEEGGKRLYISRVFRELPWTGETKPPGVDGRASAWIPATASSIEQNRSLRFAARFPGAAGKMIVRITVAVGQNILTADKFGNAVVPGLSDYDTVQIINARSTSPLSSPIEKDEPVYAIARSRRDPATKNTKWEFIADTSVASPPASPLPSIFSESDPYPLTELVPHSDPSRSDQVRIVTLTVSAVPADGSGPAQVWEGLSPDWRHRRAGRPDSLFDMFERDPVSPAKARSIPMFIERGAELETGVDVLEALRLGAPDRFEFGQAIEAPTSSDDARTIELELNGGHDGMRPTGTDYSGDGSTDPDFKGGLKLFEDVEDISIVAAPGSTFGLENSYATHAQTVANALIAHCERMKYRIAVLDSGNGQSIGDVRRFRAKFDSKHAAMYYPWVRVLDPVTSTEINLPPSGFVAGIYARNDITRAVYKAPANEVVTLALGFEKMLNKAQQEVLNPEGVNCFRFFEGRGNRLWGARTISSDPEWKYVNLRRYFAYLERSVDKATQFAVFEPNGDALWANLRRMVEDFLFAEWQSGALLGNKPEKAFFVRCDRSTMNQNDLDNGRLVCLIGVAPLRPAEFVIFRIGQFTADRP